MTEQLPKDWLRQFDFPYLVDLRLVRVRTLDRAFRPVRVSSPLADRRLAWAVRRHPRLARKRGLELRRPEFFGWRAAAGAILMPSFTPRAAR